MFLVTILTGGLWMRVKSIHSLQYLTSKNSCSPLTLFWKCLTMLSIWFEPWASSSSGRVISWAWISINSVLLHLEISRSANCSNSRSRVRETLLGLESDILIWHLSLKMTKNKILKFFQEERPYHKRIIGFYAWIAETEPMVCESRHHYCILVLYVVVCYSKKLIDIDDTKRLNRFASK